MFTKNIATSGLPLKKFLRVMEGAYGGFCVAAKGSYFQAKLLVVTREGFAKTMCNYFV